MLQESQEKVLNLELTEPQHDFFTSEKKFALFRGGIGSGKSFVGANWVIHKIQKDPRSVGFIGANTYSQLQNATLETLFNVFDEYGIGYHYNKLRHILTVGGQKIFCYSLDNFNSIRGIQIGWFWLDEVRDTKLEAFRVVQGRLRHPAAQKLEGRLTSSPSGFDWQYDYFDGDKKTHEYEVITGSSYDNIFLPPDYIDSLADSYDKKAFEQEVMGKVVNLNTGGIYYAFDRERNVKPVKYDPQYPIMVGCDFNINPMSGTVCQIYDNRIHVIDEVWLMSSNTGEFADELANRHGKGLTIVPDDTGKRKQTSSSGWSDHAILRSKGFNVASNRNPFRIDRYNSVNNMLEKGRIIIDPSCRKTIRDLEQVSYKEGSSHPDTSNSELTHISDGLGYLTWHVFPINRPKPGIQMID